MVISRKKKKKQNGHQEKEMVGFYFLSFAKL